MTKKEEDWQGWEGWEKVENIKTGWTCSCKGTRK